MASLSSKRKQKKPAAATPLPELKEDDAVHRSMLLPSPSPSGQSTPERHASTQRDSSGEREKTSKKQRRIDEISAAVSASMEHMIPQISKSLQEQQQHQIAAQETSYKLIGDTFGEFKDVLQQSTQHHSQLIKALIGQSSKQHDEDSIVKKVTTNIKEMLPDMLKQYFVPGRDLDLVSETATSTAQHHIN